MQSQLPRGFKFLTLETFASCVGEDFEVDSTPVAVKLRLERLQKFEHGPGFLTRQPFALQWSTAAEVNMVLGTYRLKNGKWGPHEVYIEPMLAAVGERRMYQSIFF